MEHARELLARIVTLPDDHGRVGAGLNGTYVCLESHVRYWGSCIQALQLVLHVPCLLTSYHRVWKLAMVGSPNENVTDLEFVEAEAVTSP